MKKIIYFLMLILTIQLVNGFTLYTDKDLLNTSVSHSAMSFSMSIIVDRVDITDTNITLDDIVCSNGVTVDRFVWSNSNEKTDSADSFCVSIVTEGGGGGSSSCRGLGTVCSVDSDCCSRYSCIDNFCYVPPGDMCFNTDECKYPYLCIDNGCKLKEEIIEESIEPEQPKNIIETAIENIVDSVKNVLGIKEPEETENDENKGKPDWIQTSIVLLVVLWLSRQIWKKYKKPELSSRQAYLS